MSKNFQKGFTLVELSIVIVIIGLIVAGVTAGQSLVKQAQLRSLISEHSKVLAAVNAFRLEYDAVPGDFDNASSYWDTAARPCGATAAAPTTANLGNCNGDGDQRVELGGTAAVSSPDQEVYRAWQHLQFANLINGPFSGRSGLTGAAGTRGDATNSPSSKFSGAFMTIIFDDATSNATGGRNVGQNVLIFGGVNANDIANDTIFSVTQARSVDDKADDGSPVTGTVRAVGAAGAAGGATCINSTPTPSIYNLSSSDASPCSVAFTL